MFISTNEMSTDTKTSPAATSASATPVGVPPLLVCPIPATPKKDVDAVLHKSQIKRARALVEQAQQAKDHAMSMARFFWYVCHLFALMGWASGLGITGTALVNTKMGDWVVPLLGLMAAIYPFSK